MRAIERKIREVLESKKNERLSKKRISEIISEINQAQTTETTNNGCGRPTIDDITISLLRTAPGPVSVENIVSEILREYPEKNRDVLFSTTRRRLGGYLKKKTGEIIVGRTEGDGVKRYTSLSGLENPETETETVKTSLIILP